MVTVVHGRGGRGRVAVAGYRCGGCSRGGHVYGFSLVQACSGLGRGAGLGKDGDDFSERKGRLRERRDIVDEMEGFR